MNKSPTNDTTWPPRRRRFPGRYAASVGASPVFPSRRAAMNSFAEISGVRRIPRPPGRVRRALFALALLAALTAVATRSCLPIGTTRREAGLLKHVVPDREDVDVAGEKPVNGVVR